MRNVDVVSGIAAIRSVLEAYREYKSDVVDPKAYLDALTCVLDQICTQNESLSGASCVQNSNSTDAFEIGRCIVPLNGNDELSSAVAKRISKLVTNNSIQLPVNVDFSDCIRMIIQVDSNDENEKIAADLTQHMLFSVIKQKPNTSFRCADMVSGGSFFSYSHSLIAQFPEKSGGAVCSNDSDFRDMLQTLESYSAAAMKTIGGKESSAYEYNKSGAVPKIQEFVVVLRLQQSTYTQDEISRLGVLLQNGLRNGTSFIIVCDGDTAAKLKKDADYSVCMCGNEVFYDISTLLPFSFSPNISISDADLSELLQKIRNSEAIDTRYESHPELRPGCFTMESSKALRIPFGVDKDNVVQYFEIGGNAPSHALIAGSTGSGKSVLLHTLIMQIAYNYHPDDVEIWAIDYKAVEFDSYIDKRTPHFRMIAHDTSDEFSLSLVDKIYDEYERRQKLFLSAGVKNINEYREIMGPHSMPRIIIFIDEFQLLTQAVQTYTGNKEYHTQLENILRLTRAMGISLILCSQTIASGLSGLTDAARDQIGCRICLKHDDDNEIRETLMLAGPDASGIITRAKNLRRGASIYKRVRWANEYAPDGKAYEFKSVYIFYIEKKTQIDMIDTINAFVKNDYTPKEVILVRGGGRIKLASKMRHPVEKFIHEHIAAEEEFLDWYPAAPTSLEDAFCLNIENTAGANILLVGEDDDLRDSIVLHSLLGFLINPNNNVIVSFIDEQYPDRERMAALLRSVHCDRLIINTGIRETLGSIHSLKRIRPNRSGNTVYIWYGLDKLKNEIFLFNQDAEEAEEVKAATSSPAESMSLEDMIADCSDFFQTIIDQSVETKQRTIPAEAEALSFEDCQNILTIAFDAGPENNHFHFAIFNNRKALKKSGLIKLENFEYRIGTRMSADDSYELFASSLAISKANETTVIYYGGSGAVIPLRPYLLPDKSWIEEYNAALTEI